MIISLPSHGNPITTAKKIFGNPIANRKSEKRQQKSKKKRLSKMVIFCDKMMTFLFVCGCFLLLFCVFFLSLRIDKLTN